MDRYPLLPKYSIFRTITPFYSPQPTTDPKEALKGALKVFDRYALYLCWVYRDHYNSSIIMQIIIEYMFIFG